MKVFGRYRKFPVIGLVILMSMLLLATSLALGSSGESKSSGGVTVMPDWTVGIQIINFLVILWVGQKIGDQTGDDLGLVRFHSPRGDGCGSNSNTAGNEGASSFKGDRIFVHRDPCAAQELFSCLTGDDE